MNDYDDIVANEVIVSFPVDVNINWLIVCIQAAVSEICRQYNDKNPKRTMWPSGEGFFDYENRPKQFSIIVHEKENRSNPEHTAMKIKKKGLERRILALLNTEDITVIGSSATNELLSLKHQLVETNQRLSALENE